MKVSKKEEFKKETPKKSKGYVVVRDYTTTMDKLYELKEGEDLPSSVKSGFISSLLTEGVIKEK